MTLQKFRKVQDVNRNGLNIKERGNSVNCNYVVVLLQCSCPRTKKETKEWLQTQDAYTLHKPTRRRFPRRQVVAYGIDHQWQADLVDLGKLASYNKGFKYLLTCIGVLSKYAWVVPLKDKTGKSLKEAFQVIFKTGRQPDRGTECFRNF